MAPISIAFFFIHSFPINTHSPQYFNPSLFHHHQNPQFSLNPNPNFIQFQLDIDRRRKINEEEEKEEEIGSNSNSSIVSIGRTMSAAVCGSKRSFFEEQLPPSPPLSKRLRCSSSTSPIRFPTIPSLFDQLRNLFPHMDQLVLISLFPFSFLFFEC